MLRRILSATVMALLLVSARPHDGYSRGRTHLADYVNPYIGSISPKTGGTSPTVLVPHGMLEISPRFTPGIGDQYLADKIFDFPVGPLSVMATTGEVQTSETKNASTFDHDLETSKAYYYQALLETYGINAEYTLTDHAVIFRFTFPKSERANVLLGAAHDGRLQSVGRDGVEGQGYVRDYRNNIGLWSGKTLYFYAEFSKPFELSGTWRGDTVSDGSGKSAGDNAGMYAGYSTTRDEGIELKIGLSEKSVNDARESLENEIPGWNFDRVRDEARDLWDKALGLIKVEGGNGNQLVTFYTALYRTMGRKGNVWDTYRCAYPLQTIIEPERTEAAIREFVGDYEKTGWLPSSGAMIGNHSTAVIADAYMKGLRDFNVAEAYAGMRKNATEATMIPWSDEGKITELERCYFEKGYYPALPARQEMKVADDAKWLADIGRIIYSKMPYQITWLPEVGVNEWVKGVNWWHRRQSVSVTLESAYDDWCLAEMAKALGKTDDYKLFIGRAKNYRNLFDPSIGFMAPKDSAGEWVRPFDPKLSGGFAGEEYFAECNSWIYTFSVQQDVQGLTNLMGGRMQFNRKLDRLFVEQTDPMDKPAFLGEFPDMSGLIGMYCQGNEPAFHIPYLYDFSGEPWKTQARVREIMELWYNSGPFGLPGDDDGGAMSSWYVFSAMGFYPVTPGRPDYEIGSPIFSRVVINVGGGKSFTVEAKGVSLRNKFIQSAQLDGRPLTKPWIRHQDIIKGGRLVFVMGPMPNKAWGSAAANAPPSISAPDGN
jgi:putative alpha-1,2-mannosidase